jgi:hypothetical protein
VCFETKDVSTVETGDKLKELLSSLKEIAGEERSEESGDAVLDHTSAGACDDSGLPSQSESESAEKATDKPTENTTVEKSSKNEEKTEATEKATSDSEVKKTQDTETVVVEDEQVELSSKQKKKKKSENRIRIAAHTYELPTAIAFEQGFLAFLTILTCFRFYSRVGLQPSPIPCLGCTAR